MRTYSTNQKAIRARIKRLTDDAWADKVNALRIRQHRAKRARDLTAAAKRRATPWPTRRPEPNGALVARVKHHLAKGRDVGDIAIRELVMVSVVQGIVDGLSAHRWGSISHRPALDV